MKRIAVDGLEHLRSKYGICLIGYAIMPDHVHVLLYPHARECDTPVAISDLLRDYKQYVAFHGKQRLREYWREHRRLWSEPLNRWAEGELGRQSIWNKRGYDFNIDRNETLLVKLDYCHKNPMTRGLVQRAEDWPWSSYRYYELDDRSVIVMDWDGQWPIIW